MHWASKEVTAFPLKLKLISLYIYIYIIHTDVYGASTSEWSRAGQKEDDLNQNSGLWGWSAEATKNPGKSRSVRDGTRIVTATEMVEHAPVNAKKNVPLLHPRSRPVDLVLVAWF
jgi:hypothetical protein